MQLFLVASFFKVNPFEEDINFSTVILRHYLREEIRNLNKEWKSLQCLRVLQKWSTKSYKNVTIEKNFRTLYMIEAQLNSSMKRR